MNHERERTLAEKHALTALADGDWRMAGYHLYNASRATLRIAGHSQGRTRDGLVQLAHRYEARGDQAARKSRERGTRSQPRREAAGENGAAASGNTWVVTERPSVRLHDVAGMREMKEIIETHILLPVRHAAVYAEYGIQPGTGVLMYGPPGNGKTLIASAIAGELDAAFIPVEMRKVLSKWFGETEQLLADLFEAAKQHPRSVIFFDEAEALFPKRSATNSSVMARVVPQLLQLIQGFDPARNCVILLGATNRPWLMDEAALRPGRFGKFVHVGLPDAEAREYMVRRAMRNSPATALDFARLAALTDGYTGADIAGPRDSVCVEAKLAALKRTIAHANGNGTSASAEPVTMTDFQSALARVKPSVTQEDIARFEAFRKQARHG